MTTHGGARPNKATRADDGRRNNRGTGRKPKKLDPSVIHLSVEAQQELRIITLHLRGIRENQQLTPRQVVEEMIRRRWLEFDADVQAKAEELAEVEAGEAIIL